MLSRKEIETIIYDVLQKNRYDKDVEVARECADAVWDKGSDIQLVGQVQGTVYRNNTFIEMPPQQIRGYTERYLTHKPCPSTKT